MDVAEDLYSKKIIEEDTFEDLQDTYEFSKNHDSKNDIEKDDFKMKIFLICIKKNKLCYNLKEG